VHTDGLMSGLSDLIKEYRQTVESDCLGDMMIFLDRLEIPYSFESLSDIEQNHVIRQKYDWAVIDTVARILGTIRSAFEKEVWKREGLI
jgi:hypothetical protein